ncbi:MAG: PD40 domain-containing protein [Leptospira sp.]|nr:PD40 domain-containing protein [Leptospira sp.]
MLQSYPSEDHKSFGSPLNTQNVEYNPIISPKGQYIVFQSNRPGGQGGMDIWVATNKAYPNRMKFPEWSSPENFKELNTESFEGMFSILFGREDDRPEEIYFTSLKSGDREGYDGLNIYFSSRIKDSKNWKKPIHLDEINSNFNDRMPAISPDGKAIVFSSDRPGGYGGFDLWISFRSMTGDKWSEPINLGPEINSEFNEISPYFHWDGETLYFSSDRNDLHKKYRFFLSNWKEKSHCRTESLEKKMTPYKSNCWDTVMELGYPFNTAIFEPETSVGAFDRYDPKIPLEDYRKSDNEYLSITHDDLWVYFSSNRPGGKGQFDIYRSPMPDSMRKSYDFIFHGLVLDGSEEKMIGLDSTIKFLDDSNPVKVITSARIGGDLKPVDPKVKTENFRTILKTGKFYRVEVSSPGFQPSSLVLDLRGNIGRDKSRYETITLEKIKPPIQKTTQIEFGIYNKKSGDPIDDAKLTLFTGSNRGGKAIDGEKNLFPIKDYPEEDFEILVKADGFKEDTFFFRLEDIPNLLDGETKLYLTNLDDIDKVYSTVIYFPFNVGDISKEDKMKLDKLADYLIRNSKDLIEIGGHTDNVASKEYNTKLSESRAQSVKEYLIKKGVPESRMKIKAYYYSQPSEDNDTQEGRAKNRRVNFKKLN